MEAEAGMAAATETQVRPAPRSRTLRDRVRRATGWLLAAPKDDKHGADPEPLRKLRGRLALALVVLAILSAFALWRASVHEELASQSDVHFRQELVLLQQLDRTTVDAIFEELAVFGSFQEHRVLHDRFVAEAQQTRDPALARRLRQEARSEQRLADVQLPAFQEQGLKFDGVDARYDAAAAYRGAVTYDTE